MRLVTEEQIRSVVTVADARVAVHDAFCALANGAALTPDEMAMKLDHGGELHVKGAYLGGDVIAFKAATGSFPAGRNSGFSAVIDAATGEPAAILQDGGWLTEMRTAAASAVTAAALSNPNPATLAILGAGIQASFQVAAMRDLFDLDVVRVWSRSAETAERFATSNDAVVAATITEAVADADIIICCTPSHEPLLSRSMVTPGAHVIAMGSDMVGKREVDADLLRSADLIVSDSVHVTARVGELQHVPDIVATSVDLGDVLIGAAVGRTDSAQISVADLCGLGIQDAAMAQLVMSRLD